MVNKYKIKNYKFVGLLVFFLILLVSSFGYYINMNKFFAQENKVADGYGGYILQRDNNDFIDEGCGTETILDVVTGLCWDKNMNRAGATMIWSSANTYCSGLSHPSGGTWRLPTNNEAMTLIDEKGNICTSLGTIGFLNCQPQNYWTSEASISYPGRYFTLSFSNGYDGHTTNAVSNYVFCIKD